MFSIQGTIDDLILQDGHRSQSSFPSTPAMSPLPSAQTGRSVAVGALTPGTRSSGAGAPRESGSLPSAKSLATSKDVATGSAVARSGYPPLVPETSDSERSEKTKDTSRSLGSNSRSTYNQQESLHFDDADASMGMSRDREGWGSATAARLAADLSKSRGLGSSSSTVGIGIAMPTSGENSEDEESGEPDKNKPYTAQEKRLLDETAVAIR